MLKTNLDVKVTALNKREQSNQEFQNIGIIERIIEVGGTRA